MMSSPMPDLPEHVMMGVNADGEGPVLVTDPEFDHNVCWCGTPGCEKYRL